MNVKNEKETKEENKDYVAWVKARAMALGVTAIMGVIAVLIYPYVAPATAVLVAMGGGIFGLTFGAGWHGVRAIHDIKLAQANKQAQKNELTQTQTE